ncbi:MAG: polynucleotide kinase-phosphatase, partial [Acidobacteria bacterium]|nr:polynucleotide kinase-phosphatase [Acidobacteriota bacterium]
MEQQVLDQVRAGLDAADAWTRLATERAVIDAEVMPWSAKGGGLIRDHYEPVGAAARTGLREATAALRQAAARDPGLAALLDRFEQRTEMAARYENAYRRYNWPVDGLEGLKIAALPRAGDRRRRARRQAAPLAHGDHPAHVLRRRHPHR